MQSSVVVLRGVTSAHILGSGALSLGVAILCAYPVLPTPPHHAESGPWTNLCSPLRGLGVVYPGSRWKFPAEFVVELKGHGILRLRSAHAPLRSGRQVRRFLEESTCLQSQVKFSSVAARTRIIQQRFVGRVLWSRRCRSCELGFGLGRACGERKNSSHSTKKSLLRTQSTFLELDLG